MIITAIKIRKVENTGNRMLGVCSLTLDNMIAIHDIKLISSDTGIFLAMPSRRTNTNTFKDIAHPISAEPRKKIEELVFELYEIVSKSTNSTLDFKCINTERTSLLDQVASDFKADESKTYSDFINDDIKKKIESWME